MAKGKRGVGGGGKRRSPPPTGPVNQQASSSSSSGGGAAAVLSDIEKGKQANENGHHHLVEEDDDISPPPPPPSASSSLHRQSSEETTPAHHLPPHYGTLVSLLQEEALEVRIGGGGTSSGLPSAATSSGSLADYNQQQSSKGEGDALLGSQQKKKKKKKWFASWFTPSFCVVALVVLNGDSARGALFPTLWPLVSSLGGDRIMQGYVVSAFSMGRLISSPYIGRLSELYGYRSILIATTILLAIGTLLYASATTIYHVLASQIVMGLGSGTLGVTRAWVAEQTVRSKRTILLAYLTAVQYAGFTVMPMAGGVLSDLFQNETLHLIGPLRADKYTAPALLMCLLCLVAVVFLATVFVEHPAKPFPHSGGATGSTAVLEQAAIQISLNNNNNNSSSNSKEEDEEAARRVAQIDGHPVRHWWPSRQDVVIVGGILLNVATKGTIAIYETLGIEFATTHFPGMTAPDAGFLFASFGLMGVCALLYMKSLCKYFNDVQLILGGMILMTLCDLLLIGPETFPVWRFYVAIFLMYAVGYPVGHTAVIGMFSKVLGKRPQGYLMGLFGSAGSLARVIFPIIGGHVAEELGNNSLFGGAAVLLTISALLLLAARDEVLHMSEVEH